MNPTDAHRVRPTSPIPARGIMMGTEILREFPPAVSMHGFRTLRFLEIWSRDRANESPPRGRLFGREALETLAFEIAGQAGLDDAIRQSLLAILCELASDEPNVPRLELACLAVADWALQQAARKSALAFAEAAALLAMNPRLALLAGKLHRQMGVARDADQWLRRASSLSTRVKDWEAKARSDEALGVSLLNAGKYKEAERRFRLALNCATRRRVRQVVGEVWHYLFIIAFTTNRYREAVVAAREAVIAYGPDHERLPHFAHDLAVYALDREDSESALSVLLALLARRHWRDDPPNLLLAHGTALRASGACGKSGEYDRIRSEFVRLAARVPEGVTHAQALLAAGRGALRLERWADAAQFLSEALSSAERTRQADIIVQAEKRLAEARERSRAPGAPPVTQRYGEVARMTVRALGGYSA